MDVDPDAVAAAALSCPGVASMSGGAVGEVATYLPGRRVVGVRVGGGEVEVHIVARWGRPLTEVADAVRQAVGAVTGGMPSSVFVEDIELPSQEEGSTGEGGGRAGAP